MSHVFQHILIIEPNTQLSIPYTFLARASHSPNITRTAQTEKALLEIQKQLPDLVCLSTSFSTQKLLTFLQSFKNYLTIQLVPIIFVVDWSERLPHLLGTTWGGKVGILHSLSSPEEVTATLQRIASAQ